MEVGLNLKGKVKSNLGDVLENRGLKQAWVAKQIDATASQMTNWCSNNKEGFAKSTPSVLFLLRLEKLLGVSVGEMYEEIKEHKTAYDFTFEGKDKDYDKKYKDYI